VLLSELHPRVAIEVPGAPAFAVVGATNEAAADFLRRSRAWRVAFGPMPFLHWQSVYKIALPLDTILAEPTEVRIDGSLLRSENFWGASTDEIEVAEGLYGNQLSGQVAVTLTTSATEVPDQVGYEFADAIASGALSRLLRIPGVEWSNPQLAMTYVAGYEEAIDRAATRVANGFKQSRTRTVRYGGY
jgi:hypothetical protein